MSYSPAASLRSLARSRGHSAAVIGTLVLGIGLALIADRTVGPLLRRPLVYPDAERLVAVWESSNTGYGSEIGVGIPDFIDWRERAVALDALAAAASRGVNLATGGEPEYLSAQVVSSGYLELLSERFELGRGFGPADDQVGAPRSVVLSHGLWQRRFGGDSAIVGKTLTLDGESFAVVGVADRALRPPKRAELWLPLSVLGGNLRIWRSSHPLELVGRLAPGHELSSAEQELDRIARSIWSAEANPGMWSGWGVRLIALDEQLIGRYRPALRLLACAVGLVVAIMLANVAQLTVVRVTAKRGEASLRLALGSSRGALMRRVAFESALLALAGSALGTVLALASGPAIARLLPPALAARLDEGSSLELAALALVLGLLTSLVATGVAALVALPKRAAEALGGLARGATAADGRFGAISVAVQVALGVPLVAGAFVAAQALAELARIDRGFRAESALSFRVALPAAPYADEVARRRFLTELEHQLGAIPGVEAVGFGSNIPSSRQGVSASTSLFVAGRPREGVPADAAGEVRAVNAGYLRALGLRLVAGRALAPGDFDLGSPRVALLNESAARALFGDRDPLGARLRDGGEPRADEPGFDPHFTLVGVVADARSAGPTSPPVAEIYLPWSHRPPRAASFVLRTAREPSSLAGEVRTALARVDPGQPLFDLVPLDELAAESTAGTRRALDLLSLLAVAAALLAAIGSYALATQRLIRRRAELGIRLAIGATPARLFAGVLGETASSSLFGGAAGALFAWQLGGALARLSGLGGGVPLGLCVGGAALLVAAAALATFRPAWDASRTDPATTLRES